MQILTDEEITTAEESAGKSYRNHKSSIHGQIIMPQDDYQWHFARAIEAKIMEKIGKPVAWMNAENTVTFHWSRNSPNDVPLYKLPEMKE